MASFLPDWINVGAPGQSDASIAAMIKVLEAARTFTHDNEIEDYRFKLSTDVEECVIDTHYAVMAHYATITIDW